MDLRQHRRIEVGMQSRRRTDRNSDSETVPGHARGKRSLSILLIKYPRIISDLLCSTTNIYSICVTSALLRVLDTWTSVMLLLLLDSDDHTVRLKYAIAQTSPEPSLTS
jgi:hypothetical protein